MGRILSLLAAAASLVLLSRPALAQTAEQWTDTTEIVVKADISGPALWRLKRGNSEVIVIGVLPVMPKSQTWKTRRVENALKGARALITPPVSKAGLGDMISVMQTKNLPDKRELKSVLPADLYARYVATAARAGVSIKPFARDKPLWAGARLRGDVLNKRGLTADEPLDTIVRLARKQSVPVRSAARYKIAPVLKDINAMSDTAGQTCLRRTLDDIDFDIDRAPKTAAAWAAGDLRGVLAAYQGSALADCLDGSDKGQAMMERGIEDTANAISDALAAPGKTVVVVALAPWLRKGGALDRVRAQGVTITSPAD